MTSKWDGQEWQESVALLHGTDCAACGDAADKAHHVITKNVMRRELGRGEIYEAAIRDPRNGMPLCDSCHDRHHHPGVHPVPAVPRDALERCHFEFAEDHGLEWRLDFDYPINEERAA